MQRNKLTALSAVTAMAWAALSVISAAANAAGDEAEQNPPAKVGRNSYVQLDSQLGSFTAVRLRGVVYSTDSYNLVLEGMYGASLFSYYGLFPTTYGVGVRGELYVATGPRHSWILSPGVDLDYVPVNHVPPSLGTDFGSSLDDAFAQAFGEVPAPVFSLAPNVDIQWVFQMRENFDLVIGGRAGLAIALSSVVDGYPGPRATVTPDLGVYVGFRF